MEEKRRAWQCTSDRNTDTFSNEKHLPIKIKINKAKQKQKKNNGTKQKQKHYCSTRIWLKNSKSDSIINIDKKRKYVKNEEVSLKYSNKRKNNIKEIIIKTKEETSSKNNCNNLFIYKMQYHFNVSFLVVYDYTRMNKHRSIYQSREIDR